MATQSLAVKTKAQSKYQEEILGDNDFQQGILDPRKPQNIF
jgi:hypothetical protein